MNTEDSEFERIEREQAIRAVPDAIQHTDNNESDDYVQGWNDCRQAMLEQPSPAEGTLAQEVIGCFNAARIEGLQEALAETTDEHLKDLVERRLMYALYAAQETTPQAHPAREPTKAMIDAAERIDWSDSDVRGNIVNMWQAMCAVAPQAPKENT